MNKQAIVEGLKELARVVVLAVVSFALTEGVLTTLLNTVGLFPDPELRLVLVGFITSALRAVDKFLHETGKAKEEDSMDKKGIVTEPSILTGGLTRF